MLNHLPRLFLSCISDDDTFPNGFLGKHRFLLTFSFRTFFFRISNDRTMADTTDDTQTWPELAIGLYDKLTGRGAEITYDIDDFELFVPSKAGDGAEHAKWKMNGTLKIRTQDNESA